MNYARSNIRKFTRFMPHNAYTILKARNSIKVGSMLQKNQITRPFSLAKVLATEISQEKAVETQISQDYLETKKKILKTFELHEEIGKGAVSLTRDYKDEKIEVKYHCLNYATPFELQQDFEEFEDLERVHHDEEEEPFGIRFEVFVTKPNNDALKFVCIATDSLKVGNVQFLPAGTDLKKFPIYIGPSFAKVNDPLSDGFFEYLADRKIDDELSDFIVNHSQIKENNEYIRWLQNLKNFTSKELRS
eukprot:gene12417-16652_t